MRRVLTGAAAGMLLSALALIPAAPAFAAANGDYTGSGVRIRKCPSTTNCTTHGLGYRGQGAAITCFKYGQQVSGSTIWYYHRNRTTGVTGYSHLSGLDYSSGTVPLC